MSKATSLSCVTASIVARTLRLDGLAQDVTDWIGREVVAGVRPESLHLPGEGRPTLEGVVDVVELTGPDAYVGLKVGKDSLIARLGPRFSPQSGEPLLLAVDTATMSLFEPATGLRI